MTLLGAKELERTFRTLGDRVQRRVTRSAVTAASTPIVKAAQQNATEDTGTLKLALKGGRKVKTYTRSGTVVAIIGPRREVKSEHKGKVKRPANYAHLVEHGHIAEDGTHVPANPFLRPAFDQTQGQALGVMKDKLAAGVVKEAKKAAGGGS
jgi:HK97 gp10 family phage protein